jgi:mono/diheme cytochrome c family protein
MPRNLLRALSIPALMTLALLVSSARGECFPWSIDMFRGAAVQPFAEAPRVTPADTLPVHGGEPPMSLEQATVKMHDPLEATPQNLAQGKIQFNTYCAPCHGESGVGDGPVAHLLSKPPKNLIAGASKDLPDGYIYGAIRNGILSMPSYAEEMPIEQRWQAVIYLRTLQQSGENKVATGK